MNPRWPVRAAIGTLATLPLAVAGFVTSSHQLSRAATGRASLAAAALPAISASSPPTTAAPRSTTSLAITTLPITSAAAPTRPATTVSTPRLAVPTSHIARSARPILGHYRVVAFYGGPNGPALGVLGSGTPDQIAVRIERAAASWAGFGRPVQPAMELIATVAQGAPGRSGTYSTAIPAADIARYLDAAHRHHMLLILDFQPGRGEFLPQVQAMSQFLLDPSVSVALDPEWKMGPTQVPATVVGSSSAASINAVVRYLSALVLTHHLRDKLLLVHQFRLAMLPDRDHIQTAAGIELVLHADGFGTPAEKLATWNALHFPGRPWGTGFKLFLRQDQPMLRPAQVIADVHPAPDVITYQ